jgi:hypothetical protein
MENLPILEVKRELRFLKEDWKRSQRLEDESVPLSYVVDCFMKIVSDDRKYYALQLIGVPRELLSDVIFSLKPIINDPYWEKIYGKENFLRLYRIPTETHINFEDFE